MNPGASPDQVQRLHQEQRVRFSLLKVENSPTILQRVIQIVRRRRINIQKFLGDQNDGETGLILIIVEADHEAVKLLKAQLGKLIDVI